MRRIAVTMVDSMVSSTFLTLLVIPAVYAIIKGWGLPHRAEARAPTNRPERILAECAHTPMLSRVSLFDRGVGQLRQAGEDIVVLSLSLENNYKEASACGCHRQIKAGYTAMMLYGRQLGAAAMFRTSVLVSLLLIGSVAARADGNSGIPDEKLQIGRLKTFRTEKEALASCRRNSVVWADRYAGYYYFKREKEYGQTAEGAYACSDAADKSNYWGTSPLAGMARGHGPGRKFPFTPLPEPFVGS